MNKATTYNLPSVAVIGCRLVLLAIPSVSSMPCSLYCCDCYSVARGDCKMMASMYKYFPFV